MAGFKPRVISLTKRQGHSFGFYLRLEHNEEGHLIRCLEMGGPAELAGMKDGDRILRVNGTFVDEMSHSEVVDMVRNSGASVTFHILDEASYVQAKARGVNLSNPQSAPVVSGGTSQVLKPKLCYLVKSRSSYGFSLRSVKGELWSMDLQHLKFHPLFFPLIRVFLRYNYKATGPAGWSGSSIMFLLVDQKTDRHYQSKHMKMGAWLATTKYLPHKPRVVNLTKGPDGYGFLLREEKNLSGHFIKDIDKGSPADRSALKEMDRLIAVDGKSVDGFSHEQVVNKIRQSGNTCSFLVVDKDTDQMYEQGKVTPMLRLEDVEDSNSPPSYTEAINLPVPVKPSILLQPRRAELKPKLCRMERTSTTYGFHLNGIQGLTRQYIKEVVKGGVADRAGLEDDDIVVEVNGVNVEESTHNEVVEMIRRSGNSLEMLVAKRSVYDQLKAQGVTITRLLLGETSYAQVHTVDTLEEVTRYEQKARPETPTEPARGRAISALSQESMDERL
ncbi:Na(+)/H(+) exchange regulatory cofactor NHE-RF3 [Epinephelus fuscoguttatus]|uniref:Na(+)/H(+) exchange regulatory cofactor NHE-RF3 n=1 Tax=Epinephelus fuscoguttatus TaxID=293821 RepID=UPI0020D01F53|nr:Na(+)/H(+) exchange regulatory cofactor NHE-RF3 [Epinephelus fuscoguttatus]